MIRWRHIIPAVGIALGALFCGGCIRPETPPVSDLGSAVAAAGERRLVPRTVELLEELAGIHLGKERYSARLEAAAGSDYSGSTAENDPRFNRLLEVELCTLMVFSAKPGETLEKRLSPVVREMLDFEQMVLWSKFDRLKGRPAGDGERGECVLALELTTGWEPARIGEFRFSSLPVPETWKRPAGSVGADLRAVLRTAAELLLLDPQGNAPDRAMTAAKLEELRIGREALAEHYLRDAEKAYAAAPGAETLARWRIAAARYIFETSVPRCLGMLKWKLD